jgi:hypothetical protein
MDIDCSQIMKNYLLNQNPLYAFNFPLSILIAIIVFGFAKAYKWSNNSYINQILIPIVTFLLAMVVIDIISRAMISQAKLDMLVNKCQNNISKPAILNNIFDKILNTSEGFTSNMNQQPSINIPDNTPPPMAFPNNPMPINYNDMNLNESKENVSDSIDNIPHIEPMPIEFTSFNDAMCIQPSNCCSLCSGSSNSNPCDLIAPIPGPQWIPQSAQTVQNRLKNNQYTESVCSIQG